MCVSRDRKKSPWLKLIEIQGGYGEKKIGWTWITALGFDLTSSPRAVLPNEPEDLFLCFLSAKIIIRGQRVGRMKEPIDIPL